MRLKKMKTGTENGNSKSEISFDFNKYSYLFVMNSRLMTTIVPDPYRVVFRNLCSEFACVCVLNLAKNSRNKKQMVDSVKSIKN